MAVNREHLYLGGKDVFVRRVGILTVLGFVASVLYVVLADGTAYYSTLCTLIGGVWVLGPPLWFYYEYVHYFPAHGNSKAGYSALKDAQGIASRIWAAFLVILAALFTDSFPK